MFNITKEIIVFSNQQWHENDRVPRTRTDYLLEIKENSAFLVFLFLSKNQFLISVLCLALVVFLY